MKLSTRTRWWLKGAALIVINVVLTCGLTAQSTAGGKIVNERTDRSTGARWVLMRDVEHPAAPAHWVLADAGKEKAGAGSKATEPKLAIHPGDKIVVEEETTVLNAWLEATALTGAENGGELRARMKIGGRIFAVRAIAPGTAELEEETRQ
jgi:hypothetical protein